MIASLSYRAWLRLDFEKPVLETGYWSLSHYPRIHLKPVSFAAFHACDTKYLQNVQGSFIMSQRWVQVGDAGFLIGSPLAVRDLICQSSSHHLCWLVFFFFISLTQTKVTWEEWISIKEFSLSDWPVYISVGLFLTNDWCRRVYSTVDDVLGRLSHFLQESRMNKEQRASRLAEFPPSSAPVRVLAIVSLSDGLGLLNVNQ